MQSADSQKRLPIHTGGDWFVGAALFIFVLLLRLLLQVLMDAQVLALAVMTELLSGDQRRRYSDLIDSPFLPALRPTVPLSHVDRPKKLPTAPQV
jgi:hypothetical protein